LAVCVVACGAQEDSGSDDPDAGGASDDAAANTTEQDGAQGDNGVDTEPVTEVERKLLHEVFTGANCGPCYESAENLERVLSENPGLFTVIKYQIGSDPYITNEAVRRRFFYLPPGQGSYDIPFVHADGVHGFHPNKINDEQGYMQADFDEFRSMPSQMELSVEHVMDGQVITATVTINPLADYPSTSLVLFVAVIENRTFHNVGINGQTEFHYVLKKLLPDQNGLALEPMVAGTPVTIERVFRFQGDFNPDTGIRSQVQHTREHTVEEFEDLSVVAFVQDVETLQVHQSGWNVPDEFPDVGSVEGRVLGADGEPLANLTVTCCDAEACLTGATGADGGYRFDGLAPAHRHLAVIADDAHVDILYAQEVGQWRPPVTVYLPARGEAPVAWSASGGGTVTLASGALELTAEPGSVVYPTGTREEEVSAVQIEIDRLPPYTLLPEGEPAWFAPNTTAVAFMMHPTILTSSQPITLKISEAAAGLEPSEEGAEFDVYAVDPLTGLASLVGIALSDGAGTLNTSPDAQITNLTAIILVAR
jgi:hypothetical protein